MSPRPAAALVVAALLAPAAAVAQGLELHVAGGVTAPIGAYAGSYDPGFHGRAGVGLPLGGLSGVQVRAEGAVHRLPERGALSGTTSLLEGTLDVRVALARPELFGIAGRLHGVAGVGLYRQDTSVGGAHTDPGARAGLGLRLGSPGATWLLEAGLTNVFADGRSSRYLPVAVGFVF